MASSSRWGTFTSRSMDSPWERRRLSSSARCNCCACCCGILQGQSISGLAGNGAEIELPRRHRSGKCIACGACIERCPVDAIAEDENGKSMVERAKCIGCGVCVIGCPTDALSWCRYPQRSGSMFPPAWRNGKRGAWSFWQRRSNAWPNSQSRETRYRTSLNCRVAWWKSGLSRRPGLVS